MKRFVVMLLATALICGSLVGCDNSNSLISKLLEILKEVEDGYELVEPPIDIPGYDSTEYVFPVDPIPPVSTDVALIRAHIDTLHEYYSDLYKTRVYKEDEDIQNTRVEVSNDIVTLAVSGYIGLAGVDGVDFGYSINNENRAFDQSFQRDPDPEIKEKLTMLGASYVNAYEIQVPMQYLPEGHYMIDLWYHSHDGFENIFYTFEVYISPDEQPSEDVSVDIDVPDVVYPGDVLVLDGDLSDWQMYSDLWAPCVFDASNLDPWVGEVGDKGFTMYTTSDMNYVYFAFDVRDDDVQFSDDGLYNGDAFQIQIDFSGWAADTEAFYRAIFYSFGLQEDGTVDVTVQCIMDDAASSIDYKMGSDDEEAWREGEIKGITKKKDDGSGWIAEYAVSWETLYRDITQKLESQGEFVPDFMPGKDEVKLHMLICYLDHATNGDGSDAGIVGAWGTPQVRDSLGNGAGWYPENAGVITHYDTANGNAYIESIFQSE